MPEINLSASTKKVLNQLFPNSPDADTKVRQLVRAEYLRELARFRRADLALSRKYGLTFDEFIAERIAQKLGYSWDVEQDAMAWETATGGILTMERKLQLMQETEHDSAA
jgi:hypothetical protein